MAARATDKRVSRYVLDSFAVLSFFWNEAGADRVREILDDRRSQRWMSVINMGEAYYKVMRRVDSSQREAAGNSMLRLLTQNPIQFVPALMPLTLRAARLKANYPLAYADCFAAALASGLHAAVVTGDPEFAQLERDNVVDIEWLPRSRR